MLIFLLLLIVMPVSAAWTNCRSLTNTTNPGSTLTDFTAVWRGTETFMKTTGGGGDFTSASGYDIGFYTNPGCNTGQITGVDRAFHDTTTGTFEYHVLIPSVTSGSATVIYVGTGDAAITTDQTSPTTAWDGSTVSVYHLPDGSSLSAEDSKNAHDGTATSITATTGKLDGGGSFGTPGTSKIVVNASGRIIADQSAVTVSMWIKTACSSSFDNLYTERNPASDIWKFTIDCATGKVEFVHRNSAAVLDNHFIPTAATVDNDAWHHVALVKNGTAVAIYVDGSSSSSGTLTGDDVLNGGSTVSQFGIDPQDTGGERFGGIMDEMRIDTTNRSAAWMAHVYVNHNDANYWTIGGGGGGGSGTRRRGMIQTQ